MLKVKNVEDKDKNNYFVNMIKSDLEDLKDDIKTVWKWKKMNSRIEW